MENAEIHAEVVSVVEFWNGASVATKGSRTLERVRESQSHNSNTAQQAWELSSTGPMIYSMHNTSLLDRFSVSISAIRYRVHSPVL